MVIKTAILHIPIFDEDASQAVRMLLRASVPSALMDVESAADSQRNWLEEILTRWCDEEELDLIITIGGTMPAPGPSNKEIVPEVTHSVVERLLPGLAEAMRAEAQDLTDLALLDRGVAGIRGRTLLVNLPSGAAPAHLFLSVITELIEPIMAHLKESSTAPTLADELELDTEDRAVPESERAPKPSGLHQDQFAAFLRRQDSQRAKDDDPSASSPAEGGG